MGNLDVYCTECGLGPQRIDVKLDPVREYLVGRLSCACGADLPVAVPAQTVVEDSAVAMARFVPIPDEELTEPIHLTVSARDMACGVDSGVGVSPWDMNRVTCTKCRKAVEEQPFWPYGPWVSK